MGRCSGRSFLHEGKGYEKLLLVLLRKVEYVRYVESLKTNPNSKLSNGILRAIRQFVYNPKSDDNEKNLKNFESFLETFAIRILLDCKTILDKDKHVCLPPLKRWENILELHIRGLLLNDKDYDKTLNDTRSTMPKFFIDKCLDKLFYTSLAKNSKPASFNLILKIGHQVFREDKKINLLNKNRAELPHTVFNADECCDDLLGRSKSWASEFTIDEEIAIRKMHRAPCVTIKVAEPNKNIINDTEKSSEQMEIVSQTQDTSQSADEQSIPADTPDSDDDISEDSYDSSTYNCRKSTTTTPSVAVYSGDGPVDLQPEVDDTAITTTDDTPNKETDEEIIAVSKTVNNASDDDFEPEIIYSAVVPVNEQEQKLIDTSMVWGSVAIGQSEIQEYPIINNTDSTIKLQGQITNNNSFKFLYEQKTTTNITVELESMDKILIAIIFIPNVVGAAVGRVSFTQYGYNKDGKLSRLKVAALLYGYGGYAKLSISTDHILFLLSETRPVGTLNTRIRLENIGDLLGYVKLTLTPRMIYPSVQKHWDIEPTEFILGPKEIQWVIIQFRPRKEDIQLIRNHANIGTITIIHGDEPTRQRIRKLYDKIRKTEQISMNNQKDIMRTFVEPICRVFPGEKSSSLDKFNNCDSPEDLEMLLQRVNRAMITLTMKIS